MGAMTMAIGPTAAVHVHAAMATMGPWLSQGPRYYIWDSRPSRPSRPRGHAATRPTSAQLLARGARRPRKDAQPCQAPRQQLIAPDAEPGRPQNQRHRVRQVLEYRRKRRYTISTSNTQSTAKYYVPAEAAT